MPAAGNEAGGSPKGRARRTGAGRRKEARGEARARGCPGRGAWGGRVAEGGAAHGSREVAGPRQGPGKAAPKPSTPSRANSGTRGPAPPAGAPPNPKVLPPRRGGRAPRVRSRAPGPDGPPLCHAPSRSRCALGSRGSPGRTGRHQGPHRLFSRLLPSRPRRVGGSGCLLQTAASRGAGARSLRLPWVLNKMQLPGGPLRRPSPRRPSDPAPSSQTRACVPVGTGPGPRSGSARSGPEAVRPPPRRAAMRRVLLTF